MNILFISRAYPPVTGGIENQNYALSVYLKEHAAITTLANRRGRAWLPLFLPYALVYGLFRAKKYDVVLLGDGVLSIIGCGLKLLGSTPVVSVLHGLDINYNSSSLNVWYEKILISLYQTFWVKIFLPALDGFIAVSEETKKIAQEYGLASQKIIVIPNGVAIPASESPFTRKDLEMLLKRNLADTSVLLTAGRLAKRKGAAWFIRTVLPKLPDNTLYIVAGAGPDQKNIEEAVRDAGMASRVCLLGRVTDDVRDLLLSTADIFLQPNIPVPGDMEGFGLTVLEATVARRAVVASRLEGLQEAIKHEENGLLVEPEDADAYVSTLNLLLQSEDKRRALGDRALAFAKEHYDWRIIAGRYAAALQSIRTSL